jgi:hypothetical protein
VSRREYFSTGLGVATIWCTGVLGFAQDLMGPESWTRYELSHWTPAWKSMPLHCVALATAVVLWWRMTQRASKEDQERK